MQGHCQVPGLQQSGWEGPVARTGRGSIARATSRVEWEAVGMSLRDCGAGAQTGQTHWGVGTGTLHWVPVTMPWTYIALRVPSPQLWSKPGHSKFPFCPSLSQGCGCSKSAPGHTAWLAECSGQAGKDVDLYSRGSQAREAKDSELGGPDTMRSPFSSLGPRHLAI